VSSLSCSSIESHMYAVFSVSSPSCSSAESYIYSVSPESYLFCSVESHINSVSSESSFCSLPGVSADPLFTILLSMYPRSHALGLWGAWSWCQRDGQSLGRQDDGQALGRRRSSGDHYTEIGIHGYNRMWPGDSPKTPPLPSCQGRAARTPPVLY